MSFINENLQICPENFKYMAELVLNYSILQTRTNKYRICEIEIYYCDYANKKKLKENKKNKEEEDEEEDEEEEEDEQEEEEDEQEEDEQQEEQDEQDDEEEEEEEEEQDEQEDEQEDEEEEEEEDEQEEEEEEEQRQLKRQLKIKLHADLYTHCHPDQLEYGKFYFHKTSKNNYKSGTYKCLDITMGNIKKGIYCGILIRSIYNLKTKKFICGPCLCVNELIGCYNCDTVYDFTKGELLSVTKNKHDFILGNSKYGDYKNKNIYCGPRIGLNKSKYPNYAYKNYRYVVMKDLITKNKKSLKKMEYD